MLKVENLEFKLNVKYTIVQLNIQLNIQLYNCKVNLNAEGEGGS